MEIIKCDRNIKTDWRMAAISEMLEQFAEVLPISSQSTIKTQVLIIGGGAAGLNAALNLDTRDAILIERNGSNSVLSPWNLMLMPKNELRKKILSTGNHLNSKELVEIFLRDYKKAVEDLKKLGLKFRKSNIGLIPDYTLPGTDARNVFVRKLKNKKVKILKGVVEKFLLNQDKKLIGVAVNLFNLKKIKIFFNYLVLAAGGFGGFFPFRTGSCDSDGSVLSLCYEAGFKMRDIEFFMFHPFLIVDKRLPRVLISGDILTKMEYEDGKGKGFLSEDIAEALRSNEHHYVFPRMTREFYLQSLKGRIFGRLTCSNDWFEKFKKENEYGFIFKKFKKDELEKIELHPAFHFSIGGLEIDKNAKTSCEDIYAAGEITGGLHGSNRIGGLAILEALVFSKRAALDINKKMGKKKKDILIPRKIIETGRLGLSEKIKKMAWKTLGPVKKRGDLEKFKNFLENKKRLTSQEKLLKKIVEICLLRKSSIGSFYRSDLKETNTAPSSFLVNKNIIFRNASA